MKKFLSLIVIVISASIAYGQATQLVSPTYLAAILLDEPTTSKMEGVCHYYKLTKVNDENGEFVYQHPDGTVFRFKVDKNGERLFPEVIVNSKDNQEKVDRVLTEAGYVKTNDGYVKGSRFEHRRSRCRVTGGTHKTLTFTKEYKATE